jgi:putative ABC transport system permease protein
MGFLMSDVRHALRMLAKNRGFAIVALLTMGLGIGANTAVFSVVDATLLRPLPFADPDRLVAVYETAERTAVERRGLSYPNFRDWQREARSFEGLAVAPFARFTLRLGDMPERLTGELVSWNYFDVLGVRPAGGRGFTPDDDRQGQAPVVVLSDALWEQAFHRDPSVIGRAVRVDEQLCTVVGIMPPGFAGRSDSAQLWIPIGRFTDAATLNNRGERWMDIAVGRLKPGVGEEQARSELQAIAGQLDKMFPSDAGRRSAGVAPLRDEFFGQIRPVLLVLLGAVGFVLLIACVNVANLLLARGSVRRREVAVRSTLGAMRGRIIRQLLTESVVLSILGGAAGLLAAFWSIDLLVALSPVTLPSFVRIGVNPQVLAFTSLTCVVSGLLFGVAPAIAASRTDLVSTLKAGSREDGGSGSIRLRKGLVAAEIALALVLLVGAGLMLRTMQRLQAFDPGFRPAGLVTLRVALPGASGNDVDAVRARFAQTLLERVRDLPTVTSASLSSDVPLGSSVSATIARFDEGDRAPVRIYRHVVSPGHFQTLGVPLLAGRDFTAGDRQGADHVAIVSRAMARRHWPIGDALHKRFRIGSAAFEVVGIVGDVKHRQLLEADTADPDVYLPLFQRPAQGFSVLARTSGDVQPVVSAIRQAVRNLNGDVPVFAVATGEELLAGQTARARFGSAMLVVFALLALTLTMVGIYGVTAFAVSRQMRQVGIRIALGATRGDVLRHVLGGGLAFILAGLGIGIAAALALTRLLETLIYGVSATDPATFVSVVALLGAVGLLACYLPALRATRIDPVVALRAE